MSISHRMISQGGFSLEETVKSACVFAVSNRSQFLSHFKFSDIDAILRVKLQKSGR